ncbi:cupin domain-containing protein [Burkholderia sp. SIMBA_043]|uniref:cupin domain-containing protein n=1 Tax=Burkholderia TaxID=32008 RepID=UPI0005D99B52|nr:cupin domain-containing protein [Burkholderia vietnamiensis]AJY08886.1 cupin domain protein [Burkholderia vietnamiensis LMG 10929]AVR14776.1 cupin domain-containing protein [Burkholderia vietnamiensis]UBI28770.1 cupin domain-containing protein [Burkholderia vietnamiensis]
MKKKRLQLNVVNVEDVEAVDHMEGTHWGGSYKSLTPVLDTVPGRIGVNLSRVPPGRTACPFHTHAREDEVFFVLSGRGVFRYGDTLREIGPGDCISCPASSGIGHQLANPFDEDLVYLAMGLNDPHEVCTYPDSGKVMIRSLKTVGRIDTADYMDGEANMPQIFAMHTTAGPAPRKRKSSGRQKSKKA